jgi:hypothetical protein
MVEVAPNTKVLPVDQKRIPALAVMAFKPIKVTLPNGITVTAYTVHDELHDAWLRISEAERLPFGLSAEVIRKLINGGFVEGCRSAPNNSMVNCRSLLEHIQACRDDWDFWKRDGRKQRFDDGVDFSTDEEVGG